MPPERTCMMSVHMICAIALAIAWQEQCRYIGLPNSWAMTHLIRPCFMHKERKTICSRLLRRLLGHKREQRSNILWESSGMADQFGNYRLLRLLGQGGFADTYLGEQIYLHTQAAVKVVQTSFGQGDQESFFNEARMI